MSATSLFGYVFITYYYFLIYLFHISESEAIYRFLNYNQNDYNVT
jgi:hypothetical protein